MVHSALDIWNFKCLEALHVRIRSGSRREDPIVMSHLLIIEEGNPTMLHPSVRYVQLLEALSTKLYL
jgi:hypothetical protein